MESSADFTEIPDCFGAVDEPRNGIELLSVDPAFHQTAGMPQMLNDRGYGLFNLSESSHLSDCTALISGHRCQSQLNEEDQGWSSFLALFPPTPEDSLNFAQGSGGTIHSTPNETIKGKAAIPNHSAELTVTAAAQQNIPQSYVAADVSVRRARPRKQNHSCDPCRAGKKACDLGLDIEIHDQKPLKSCSMCDTRGLECTAEWLASRQLLQQSRKRSRASFEAIEPCSKASYVAKVPDPCLPEKLLSGCLCIPSIPEMDLERNFNTQGTCLQHFNLYVDIYDMPVTLCLSQGCMPPIYPQGIAALTPLSESTHSAEFLDTAFSWIKDCWHTNSTSWTTTAAAPHLFFAVSVLDAVFHPYFSRLKGTQRTSRNSALNETYKWVATATAAQFMINTNVSGHSDMAKSQSRDFASAAWRKAKQKVFEHIASTSSFRLSLSLLLFGSILPPKGYPQSSDFVEDANYARSEGLCRLRSLCAKARACFTRENISLNASTTQYGSRNTKRGFTPVCALPSSTRGYLLELVSAVDWLVTMANSFAIITSRGRFCAFHPDEPTSDWDGDATGKDLSPEATESGAVVLHHDERTIEQSIVLRAKREVQTVTTLWNNNTPEEVVMNAVSKSGALTVLLGKAFAVLTLTIEDLRLGQPDLESIYSHYVRTSAMINLWRATFGRFENSTRSTLQNSAARVRQGIAFCSNDGDLVVLQFNELVRHLETLLETQPATPAKEKLLQLIRSSSSRRREHRLMSAKQVAFLGAINMSISSPGFEGRSGLKTYVRDIAAHPLPEIVVQAYTLAAKTFADEIQECFRQVDTRRASEMTEDLEVCLQALRGLEETLVNFPQYSDNYEETETP